LFLSLPGSSAACTGSSLRFTKQAQPRSPGCCKKA
jgi:hypothetical protein